MMHEGVRNRGEFTEAPALRVGLRRSLGREMRRALYLVLLAAGVSGGLVAALLPLRWQPFVLAAAMLASGAVVGLIALRRLSDAIARTLARSLELLLAQPGMAEEVAAEGLNLQGGRALSRAEIEADVAALNRHMRRLAREAQAGIAELERAREQANLQNLAKSHFLAKMSHELRTPLNAILGYAMLLQEDAAESGNDSAISDLERIQSAGRNLLTVINDILDLARLDSGKAAIERGVIDVREIAEAVVASCPADQRNGNRFEMIVADEIGIMIGDKTKVRQCLLNLLSNAFKFTTEGTVTLQIEPAEKAPASSICFAVRDTGIGIDAAQLEGLFDAFSQLEPGPGRRYNGTGLGLAITRRLARMMGGDCTARSAIGEGSEFLLTLPLSPAGLEQPVDAPFASTLSHRLPLRRAERCALVIDDDEAAIDLMQRWLQRIGYDVFATTDGEAGLELMREHKPDLVLLDALLPGRSGYDILKEIRSDRDLGLIPVVLITVDDDRARGLNAGASDYLRKPVTEDQLRAVTEIYRGKASGEILVIDDDDDAAELIQRSVEQVGFSSRRASDGIEGVEMASSLRPAAIVLDIAMPRLDGFGVIDRLSADASLTSIPVVVLSGCDISISQHRSLAAAGHRVFTKGASTPREIAQSLRELVA